jgi:hypothetical protein
MRRRRILVAVLLGALVAMCVAPESAAARREIGPRHSPTGSAESRPDGWIKLCGLSLGCVIDPLPHPWLGRDVHNATGRRQTVKVDINEGEGVRFWVTIQNDGSVADTIRVQGCRGNRTFELNRVLLGKHKRQDAGAEDLTNGYRNGTLTFDLDPNETEVFTINIITHFDKGVTYECVTRFTSAADPDAEDVVVAEMTTY